MDQKKRNDAILEALHSYRMQSLQDEEGNGYSLIDLLSFGHPTCKEGKDEALLLAEHITDALDNV